MAYETSIRQATTPTVEIVTDEPLTDMWFCVAFEQGGTVLVKDKDDCGLSDDGLTITVTLTQEETLLFHPDNSVRVQVRFGTAGSVQATDIGTFGILETIDKEVV